MTRTGRNDPCPCGSGKKYKRCCLAAEGPIRADEPMGDVAARVAMRILEWAGDRFPARMNELKAETKALYALSEDFIGFVMPLLAFAGGPDDDQRFSVLFRDRYERDLDIQERAVLGAMIDTWYGVWEVQEVMPGEGLRLVDQLTGEERGVREKSASETLQVRDTLLGCVVRAGAGWQISGIYPRPLPPGVAETVVQAFRRAHGMRTKRVPAERLRGRSAFRLGELWCDALEALDTRGPPILQNMDGDPLEPTVDHFAFAADAREDVVRALLEREGAEDHTDDGAQARGETIVGLQRAVKNATADSDAMTVARFVVGASSLEVQTNSKKRADAACALLVESPVGARVTRGDRTRQSIEEMMAAVAEPEGGDVADDEADGLSPQESAAFVLAMKERHYEAWIDQPVPALGGKTPREAAGDRRRRVYRDLDLLLRDMENGEQRLPAPERYDFRALRERLGLAP